MAVKFLTGVDLNNQRGLAFADPSSATDAANKQYVDALIAGLKWKTEVRAASTANGTFATAFVSGASMDGLTLGTGERILLKDQTAQTENGIFLVTAGAPTRTTDADSSAELDSATVFVRAGTVNKDTAWTQTTDLPTIGVSNIVFVAFGGGGSYTADGIGIELSGSQFALELDGTSLSKSGSGLRIGSAAAASGLTESSGLLSVGAGTGITVNANDVAIDTSVVARKYVRTTIGDNSATTITVTHNLGQAAVQVELYLTSSGATVFCDVTNRQTNAVDLVFATAPTTNQYTVVVIG